MSRTLNLLNVNNKYYKTLGMNHCLKSEIVAEKAQLHHHVRPLNQVTVGTKLSNIVAAAADMLTDT